MTNYRAVLAWSELFWPQPMDSQQAAWLFRNLASDHRLLPLVFETVASGGQVRHLLAVSSFQATTISQFAKLHIDHLTVRPLATPDRQPAMTSAAAVRFRSDELLLDVANPAQVSRSILAALAATTRPDEALSVQVALWRGLAPQTAHKGHGGRSGATPGVWVDFWRGLVGLKPRESQAALKSGISAKAAQHGFMATVRVGVCAATASRREHLALGLLAALGTVTAPGVSIDWRRIPARRFANPRQTSWLWPSRDDSRLTASEIPPLLGLPLATTDDNLPGLPPAHPKLLPLPAKQSSPRTTERAERIFATSNAPATLNQPIGLATRDNLTHLSITAPTGAGKSTLLQHLIAGDITDGAGVVVIDPKGDLVQSVLSTIPESRKNDVVILDPTDQQLAVGFNPLRVVSGGSPEISAESIVNVMTQLWPDTGVRTFDVLSAAITTLTKHNAALTREGQPNDATLLDVPRLLSDQNFQRKTLGSLDDPVLAGFWAGHNALSTAQQAEVIAPVMRRLRQFLAHPTLRAVLGQADPRFDISEVFTSPNAKNGIGRPKILLVPLNKAVLGNQTAQLFGSLIIGEIWHQTLRRAKTPQKFRTPVSVIIDEAPELLRLPLSLGDALAQARGYGVGFTLVNQFHSQWPRELRDAVDANTLSKICFRLPADDARHMSRVSGGDVDPEDFTSLGQYETYASLAHNGHPGDWFSARTLPPPEATTNPERIRQLSRERYGQAPGQRQPSSGDSQPTDPTTGNPASASEEQPGRKRRSA